MRSEISDSLHRKRGLYLVLHRAARWDVVGHGRYDTGHDETVKEVLVFSSDIARRPPRENRRKNRHDEWHEQKNHANVDESHHRSAGGEEEFFYPPREAKHQLQEHQ